MGNSPEIEDDEEGGVVGRSLDKGTSADEFEHNYQRPDAEKHTTDRYLTTESQYQKNPSETSRAKIQRKKSKYLKHVENDVIRKYQDMQHVYQTSFENDWRPGMVKGLPELHKQGYDDDWQGKPHWRTKRQSELFESLAPPSCRVFARQTCN